MQTDRGHKNAGANWLYSDAIKIDLSNKSVLDYGHGRGNLPQHSLPETTTYTGLDLQEDILQVSSTFPEDRTFLYYDKYHTSYNFNGSKTTSLSDVTSDTFDVIFAWNVFTHCTYKYTKACLNEMRPHLKDGGIIVFNLYSTNKLIPLSSTIKTNADRMAELTWSETDWRYGRDASNVDVVTSIDDVSNHLYWENYSTLTYDNSINEDIERQSLFSFYNIDWVDSENSDWTLRDNYDNKVYTFTTS